MFQGFEINCSDRSRDSTASEFSKDGTIDRLVDCLNERFQQSSVLKATKLADFLVWPKYSNYADLGDEDLEILVEHFSPVLSKAGFNAEEIYTEWQMLRNMIYESDSDVNQLTWEAINIQYKEGHRNFLALVDIILSLPTSSADAERGFSEMKMVKTDWRCRLRTEALNDLMHIKFNTQDVAQFNPLSSIHLWNSSAVRQRRPFYLDDNNNSYYDYSSEEEL